MLPNSSFEEIDGKRPRAWSPNTWNGTGELTVDSTVARTGKNSVRIHSDTGFDASWSLHWVEMKPNTRYRASVWIKTANLQLVSGKGVCMSRQGTYERTELITRDGDWRQVTVDLDSGTHKVIHFNLTLGSWGLAKGTAWFDDVEFCELGPSDKAPAVAAAPPAAAPPPAAPPAAVPAVAPAPAKPKLLPVPDAAALAKYRALMLEVMGDQLRNATSQQHRQALARRLLEVALGNTGGEPAERYVLLTEARDQAVRAVDYVLVGSVIDDLAAIFDVQPLELKADAFVSASTLAKSDGDFARLAKAVEPLFEQAIDAENYPMGKRLAQLLSVAAARGKDRDLSIAVMAKNKELAQLTAMHKDYLEAVKTLEAAPKDGKARLAVGRYVCLVQGDWETGLPLLSDEGAAAQGPFAALRAAARLDLTQPPEPSERRKLADAWWSLAEDKSEGMRPRTRMRERAAHWYRAALANLPDGLEQKFIEARIAQVAEPKAIASTTANPSSQIKLPHTLRKPEVITREESDLLISVDASNTHDDERVLQSVAQGGKTDASRGGILMARRVWDQADVMIIHPHAPTHPARIEFTGIARLGPGQIRLALRCLPAADTRAILKINERRVWSHDVNGKDWLLAEIEFKQGDRVVVEHHASGWMQEFLFFSYQAKLSRVTIPGEPPAFDFTQAKDAAAAQAAQQAWAKHLGVPVNSELDPKGVKLGVTLVPPGVYHIGSRAEPGQAPNDERQQLTAISRPFLMGTTEVTKAQFERFVEETGYKTLAERIGKMSSFVRGGFVTGPSWRDPGFGQQQPDHPVVGIAWADALAYCDWLSRRLGRTVRLPTEAEWELACRAGTTTRYPWGDDPADGKGWANVGDLSMEAKIPSRQGGWGWDDGHAFTSPVGAFKPNAFGLHDTIGGVWEWTSSRLHGYGRGRATDPVGASQGQWILRGGSWVDTRDLSRTAHRHPIRQSYCGDNVGFRIVAPLLPEPPARHPLVLAKLALGDTGLVLTTAADHARVAVAKDDGSVGQLWLVLQDRDDLVLTHLVSGNAVDMPIHDGRFEDLCLYGEHAQTHQRWFWLGEGRDKAIQSRFKDRVLHAQDDGSVILQPHDPKSPAQRWRIVEVRDAAEPKKDKPAAAAEPADVLPVNSVWVSDAPRMVLTITSRTADTFTATFEVGDQIERVVSGTIKDGKLGWQPKDVRAVRGGPGGHNMGAHGRDNLGEKLDFFWRDQADHGKFTLRRSKGQ